MASELELRPHPSKHPETGAPLFPQLRSIWAPGYGTASKDNPYGHGLVGYTGDPPYHRITFINHWAGKNIGFVTAARILVEQEFGISPDKWTNVPEPVEIEALDGEDDE